MIENNTQPTSTMLDEKKPMTAQEMGAKGGKSTKEKYGPDHYKKIGAMGGKKGGLATKANKDPDYYRRIGAMGGQKVKAIMEAAKLAAAAEANKSE